MAQPLPQDIQNLIAQAVTAAVQAALQNVPAPQINVQAATDHIKPGKYKGERGRDLDRFLSQCDAYWVTANITNDRKRVLTALGLLESSAAQWSIGITDHMAQNAGVLPTGVATWDLFKTEIRKFFGDATPEETAITELTKLCNLEFKERNVRDVAAYVTEFRTFVDKISGLSDKDKEIRFTSGLPNWLFRTLATAESPPANYEAWVTRALKAYAASQRVREREAAEKKSSSSSTTSTTKTTTTTTSRTPVYTPAPRASNSGPVPMDVDASRIRREYRPDTRCYRCQKITKPPHMANECKEPEENCPPRRQRVQASTTELPAASSSSPSSSTISAVTQIAQHEQTIASLRDTIDAMHKEMEEMKRAKEDF